MSRAVRQRGVALCSLVAALLCVPTAAAAPAAKRDRSKPVVAFKAPVGGSTVSGSLSGAACEASATDKVGIDRVQFSVHGAALNEVRAAPYNCVWDTTGVPSGQYTLTARAVDTSGNAATTSVTVNVAASEPAPPSTPEPTPTPTPDPGGLPAGVTLRDIDGGLGYYGGFADGLPTDPTYFPIGAWFRSACNQTQIDAYRDFGMNLFVGVENPPLDDRGQPSPCGANMPLLGAAGMKALVQLNERHRFNNLGPETAGWLLEDEVDMRFGPGAGYTVMQDANAQAAADGKARYANYGKGVYMWESDAEAQRFVNEFQQLVSADMYWMTDPNEKGRSEYGWPHSYGTTVDRMRFLDGLDGQRKPIWNFVETGWPWTEDPAMQPHGRILPAELRAAVWHSIIAGARGIIYFDHQFNGTCSETVIRGECYQDTRAAAKATNLQVKQLAAVLNSPFADGYASAPQGVRLMTKRTSSGEFYVFAGSTRGLAQQTPISVKSGTTADVVGEGRSVPIVDGIIADWFADRNAIHIYRIS